MAHNTPAEAPRGLSFRSQAHERLISRALFETPDGVIHQTSIYSTHADDSADVDEEERQRRISVYAEVYTKLGYKLLRMEFVQQLGWEL